MKKILLCNVPVGKTFVFNHRMYRRTGWLYPEEYNTLGVPCVPVGVIHNNFERYFYCYTKVEA